MLDLTHDIFASTDTTTPYMHIYGVLTFSIFARDSTGRAT